MRLHFHLKDVKTMDINWMNQKLAQNGFTLQDLSEQTGLPLEKLETISSTSSADEADWNLILDTLNDYPALQAPAADILQDLQQDIETYGADAQVRVYYGVNQSDLIFCEYECLEDGRLHGAPVPITFLTDFILPLQDALTLFTRQNFTLQRPVSSAEEN